MDKDIKNNEHVTKIIKIILIILIVLLLIYIIRRIWSYINENYETKVSKKYIKIGIATTLKNPHKLNDWIKYHLSIGFSKLYIVFDDENEEFELINPLYINNVMIIKSDKNWRKELEQLPNMEQFINDKKEVMSRQILNFTNCRNYAYKDNIDWLLHIDADELFYPEKSTVQEVFNEEVTDTFDVITFKNYEMVPKRDDYENCFINGVDFKTNTGSFNAYSNGKSAVKVRSPAAIAGVHDFSGNMKLIPPYGKILHYPSCNFDEYINKYKILGKFSDKWWDNVQIPFKFHTESRDLVTSCANNSTDECVNKVREYYNKSNVFTTSNNYSIQVIEFAKNILN